MDICMAVDRHEEPCPLILRHESSLGRFHRFVLCMQT